MKTIKFLSMAALALVGAMMTSCSNDDNSIIDNPQQPENLKKVVTLTATVGLDGGEAGARAITRALTSDGVKTFADGDQIAVIYKNTSGETVKAVSEAISSGAGTASATFSVTLTNPDNTKAIRYIYPAAMAKATVATDATMDDAGTVDFSNLDNQNGSLTTLGSTLDLCTYDADNWTSGALPNGTLTNKLAVLAITLKNNAGTSEITSGVTGMTLSDGTNSYTVTRSAAAGPIYVAIRPTVAANINITASKGSINYTKSITSKTYAAGNGYNVSWKMSKGTITWNATKIDNNLSIYQHADYEVSDYNSSDGITVTVSTGEFGDELQFSTYLYIGDGWGSITFSSSVGNISKIEINHTGDGQWNDEAGSGWPAGYKQSEGGTYTWSGSPSSSISLEGEGHLIDITSIVFTLE